MLQPQLRGDEIAEAIADERKPQAKKCDAMAGITEEKETDLTLSQLAESNINQEAS